MRRRGIAAVILTLGLTSGMSAACGSGPAAPAPQGFGLTHASAQYEGAWRIEYRVAECSGRRHCFALLGQTQLITANLVATGNSDFAGVVSIGNEHVDVRGALATDGSLLLNGIRQALLPGDYQTRIDRLELRVVNGVPAGSFDFTTTGPPDGAFYGPSRLAGAIVSAVRQPALPGALATRFDGMWTGRLVIRDCTTVGWPNCYPHDADEVWPIELSLTQSEDRASGSLYISEGTRILVEGRVMGHVLELSGSTTKPNYAFDRVETLHPSILTRDKLGRLAGTIAFDVKWVPKLPNLWTYKETIFRRAELANVNLRR